MEDKTCKTCKYNDNFLCDKKGIWITDDHTCTKWQQEIHIDFRETELAQWLKKKKG